MQASGQHPVAQQETAEAQTAVQAGLATFIALAVAQEGSITEVHEPHQARTAEAAEVRVGITPLLALLVVPALAV